MNGMNFDSAMVQPFLNRLNSQNDYVLAYRVLHSTKPGTGSDYFILAGKDKHRQAFTYSVKNKVLKLLNLSETSLDLIWRTIVQNKLFIIRNEKDIANFCAEKYNIYNSYTYEFIILSGERMKRLCYYNPEYYDEACFGMAERQMIINCVAAINYIVSR